MTAHLVLCDPNDKNPDDFHQSETQFLQAPLEREYADILNRFISNHYAEISELLRAAGCEDPNAVVQPEWYRFATMDDIQLSGSIEDQRSAAADLISSVNAEAGASRE